MDTIAENRKNFTSREFERAKHARNLCHNAGAPGIKKFKGMLRTNRTQECPVIEKDIDITTEIWGPDVACLKGKTTRKKPKEFVDEAVEMPLELAVRMSEVITHMDNSHMSRMTFLSCTVKPMFCRNAVPLTDATADALHKALDRIT